MRRIIFECKNVPVVQNRLMATEAASKSAVTGDLAIYLEDGFAWNEAFDPSLVEYNEDYNNAVPSIVMDEYYREIADHLARRYDLSAGPVLEIGCGKGTFLGTLVERHGVQGVGVDPAYEGPEKAGNLTFFKSLFHSKLLQVEPSLVVCRHTLEHIQDPTAFLTNVIQSVSHSRPLPIFCEVPDLQWILREAAWWDFCYEHVNYFTRSSFAECLMKSGCSEVHTSLGYEGQYLWAEGVVGASPGASRGASASERGPGPLESMDHHLAESMARLKELQKLGSLVIWGMATKGVMYTLQAKRHGVEIEHAVDIDKLKQGRYVPVTGQRVQAPQDLPSGKRYVVVCMNPSYQREIRAKLDALGLDAEVVAP